MRAGDLDRLITLQHRSYTQNTQYEQVPSYTEYDVVWAKKLDVRGREFFAAQQTNAELTTRFHIRWRDDVVPTDRLVTDAATYDIFQVSEIGRRQGLELFATAAV